MTASKKSMAILNRESQAVNLTKEESDMIEQVASKLDGATYTLLNDLLQEIKSEVDEDEVLKEVELRYESLGLTVKFLGDRAGKEVVLKESEKKQLDKELDYFV